MNEKTKSIIFITLAVIGICIALAGIRMKATDPQSFGTMVMWIGVAIAFVGSFLSRTSRTSKK